MHYPWPTRLLGAFGTFAPGMFIVASVMAAEVSVTGAVGAPGVDGEAAVAVANSSDAFNSAEATGGYGGSAAIAGNGGRATASGETNLLSGDAVAAARAYGGTGGVGVADAGGRAGNGGDATASAEAITANGDAAAVIGVTGGQGGG